MWDTFHYHKFNKNDQDFKISGCARWGDQTIRTYTTDLVSKKGSEK